MIESNFFGLCHQLTKSLKQQLYFNSIRNSNSHAKFKLHIMNKLAARKPYRIISGGNKKKRQKILTGS